MGKLKRFFARIPVLGYFLRIIFNIIKLPILKSRIEHIHEMLLDLNNVVKVDNLSIFENNEKLMLELNHIVKVGNLSRFENIEKLMLELNHLVKVNAEDKFNNIHFFIEDINKNVKLRQESKIMNIENIIQNHESSIQNHELSIQNHESSIQNHQQSFSQVDEIKGSLKNISQNINDHRLSITDQQRRINLFFDEMKGKKDKIRIKEDDQKIEISDEEKHILDALYVSFEDRFRGTRAEIKNRQKIYLNYLEKVNFTENEIDILDIGCGRGEWLELLKENNYRAKGVDLNNIMIEQCEKMNFQVEKSDALAYLRSIPDSSLSVVTGFHIIEHVPNLYLVKLFDEVLRVLRQGGLAIFETPNPENLVVGACNFYSDPTHVKPLFPPTMKFIMKQRGFSDTEILKLHRRGNPKKNADPELDSLIQLMNNEQDFAIIGYKA